MKKKAIKCEVYQFDSMNDIKHPVAQAAIEKYKENNSDYYYDHIYADLIVAAKCLGIETSENNICWTGFWSQGDGASFEGEWTICNLNDPIECVKENFTKDKELLNIAKRIDNLICDIEVDYVSVRRMYHTRYCHSSTLGVYEYEAKDSDNGDYESLEQDAERILEIFQDLSDWLYSKLEEEYNYQSSDKVIMQIFIDNKYEFDKDGNII